MSSAQIIHGDCREALKAMPDNYANIVITSPPYNMNLRIRNGKYCSRQIVKELSTKYDGFADNMPMQEYYEFNRDAVSQLLRVSDLVFYNVQILTGNKPALFKLIGEFHSTLKEMIVWDKVNAEPAIGAGVMNSRFELILVFQNSAPESRKFETANFKRGELQNLWQIKRGQKIAKNHGAVFPVDLAEKIISNFCPAGGTVLDPFAGTGSTGVACQNTGRNFIGIEQSSQYVDIMKTRLGI